jgi:pilus assembly protein CpaB
MAWRYVDQANRQTVQTVEMTDVVVARVAIPARTIISPELVRVQRMPTQAVHPQAVLSLDMAVGKVVKSDVVADEEVLTSRLFLQRGESGLAFMIPEGSRAISVGFTELIGTGGMVSPGDRVDVIGVFEEKVNDLPQSSAKSGGPNNNNNGPTPPDQTTSIATMVLQNVPVLAVAQHLEGEDTTKKDQVLPVPAVPGMKGQQQMPPPQVRSEPAPMPTAKTATLAVNPEDALKVVLAESKGQIRLALRQANDKSTPSVPQVPMSALLSPPSSPSSTSASAASAGR